MEAIRAVQREYKQLGKSGCYQGEIQINLDYEKRQIEIRDNGKGMTDSDVRNAVNYGRLKNRIAPSGDAEKASDYPFYELQCSGELNPASSLGRAGTSASTASASSPSSSSART